MVGLIPGALAAPDDLLVLQPNHARGDRPVRPHPDDGLPVSIDQIAALLADARFGIAFVKHQELTVLRWEVARLASLNDAPCTGHLLKR